MRTWEKSVGKLNNVSLGSLVKRKQKQPKNELHTTDSKDKKVIEKAVENPPGEKPSETASGNGGSLSLLGNYSSSDSSDDS